jgi:hypothetical protein
LVHVDEKICLAPLKDVSLGCLLRVKPIPMPNRTLDVNLCYLRTVFKEHKVVCPSIKQNDRCKVSDIPVNVLTKMLFQTVLLRYTGRIYCFEEYYQFCLEKKSETHDMEKARRIPFQKECNDFLDFVQLHMQQRNIEQLGGWISKHHDGAIAHDLKRYYQNFRDLLKTYLPTLEVR